MERIWIRTKGTRTMCVGPKLMMGGYIKILGKEMR